ncbi:MAG: RHS domain-containing protein, partial [gamma proteobacterium symbiont of Taylorina sp.]|nr:RHS domain-containing protein [gamma proteobacterium symbiont of Taylorina sp.]
YIHSDHLGTPHSLSDENGVEVWYAEYDPFGKANINDDPDGDGISITFNIRLPGQYEDQESGLYYNFFRYYDPSLGRYITSDPIGLAGGINTYIYVDGNPLIFTDPFGLAFFSKRPLGQNHGNPNRSPLSDKLNTELKHEQLFFEDSKGGNLGFFNNNNGGKVRADTPNMLGRYWPQKQGNYDDALMREAVKNVGNPGRYCLIGNNCQDWAEKVRDEYEQLKKARGICNP